MSCPTERKWSSSCRLFEVGLFLLLWQADSDRSSFQLKQHNSCLLIQLASHAHKRKKVTLAYLKYQHMKLSCLVFFPVKLHVYLIFRPMVQGINGHPEVKTETTLFCSQMLFSPKSCSGKLNRQTIM